MDRRIKEAVLRKYDDTGADTLDKYWAQIEYTAYWCTRLLIPQSHIKGVIPEGIDDVTLVKENCLELHQVKCRDESQPPWTSADVIPLLCKQYLKRKAFTQPCQFYFVSDHVADTKTQLRPGISYGPLYRLKSLLDIEHDGQPLTAEESAEFRELEVVILHKIIELMKENGEDIDVQTARELLHNTWIDTASVHIRRRPIQMDLSDALQEAFPGQTACNVLQLEEICQRLLYCIVEKIIRGKSLSERTIVYSDVIACRTEAVTPESNLPDLNLLPGNSVAEKRALFGGFDGTELPVFALQMKSAQYKRRRLEALGLDENAEDLSLALMTLQAQTRRNISLNRSGLKIGPYIMEELHPRLLDYIHSYFPGRIDIDTPFCHGLLWLATNDCILWWHGTPIEEHL